MTINLFGLPLAEVGHAHIDKFNQSDLKAKLEDGSPGLPRPERICNYRISRGRRVVVNAYEIVPNQGRVFLATMQKHSEVVTDIALICGTSGSSDGINTRINYD